MNWSEMLTPRTVTQRGLSPGGLRLAANRSPALATAVRVVDRVHNGAAHGGPLAEMSTAAGFSNP